MTMSNKFTEEQYQKIIEKWDGEISYIEATKAVVSYLAVEDLGYSISNQALALANPLTREWAHDKFVEKENKFHFILKDIQETQGERHHLVRSGRGAIIIYPFAGNDKPKFKESEIKLWGYNPEMFDKEEV